jgi:hypothetical protein
VSAATAASPSRPFSSRRPKIKGRRLPERPIQKVTATASERAATKITTTTTTTTITQQPTATCPHHYETRQRRAPVALSLSQLGGDDHKRQRCARARCMAPLGRGGGIRTATVRNDNNNRAQYCRGRPPNEPNDATRRRPTWIAMGRLRRLRPSEPRPTSDRANSLRSRRAGAIRDRFKRPAGAGSRRAGVTTGCSPNEFGAHHALAPARCAAAVGASCMCVLNMSRRVADDSFSALVVGGVGRPRRRRLKTGRRHANQYCCARAIRCRHQRNSRPAGFCIARLRSVRSVGWPAAVVLFRFAEANKTRPMGKK